MRQLKKYLMTLICCTFRMFGRRQRERILTGQNEHLFVVNLGVSALCDIIWGTLRTV